MVLETTIATALRHREDGLTTRTRRSAVTAMSSPYEDDDDYVDPDDEESPEKE